MILWIVLAAMAAFAAFLVVWPLVRGGRADATRDAQALEIYRDQLDEVDRDAGRGLIDAAEAEAARAEIGRRILALGGTDGDGATAAQGGPETAGRGDAAPPARRRPRFAAIAAGLAVPAVAAAVYLVHGSPGLPGLPAAGRQVATGGGETARALQARVERLADALQKNPDDLADWVALGDTLSALRRHDKAVVAYRQAMRLAPHSAALAARYGEALTFAEGGQVTPDARAAFEEALRRDAGEPRAQYYLGLADRQGGQLQSALDRWLALEASSPPDAPWLGFLRPRIASLADQLGLDADALADRRKSARAAAGPPPPAASSGSPSGPTREQVEAARDMSAADRAKMIRGMVDRLAARLEDDPGDADGWLRLGRARTVLGEHDRAKAAYAHAAKLRPDDVGVLVAWADSIVAAAGQGALPADELKPVVGRILAQAPRQPRALWLAGLLARADGDAATARARWSALLDRLPPDSPERAQLRKQLDALPPAQ